MNHRAAALCAAILCMAAMLLFTLPATADLEGPTLSYDGDYRFLPEGYLLLSLTNHGYDVNATVWATYAYACDMGPEFHTATAHVAHAELGTFWLLLPLVPATTPEMCAPAPTLDDVTITVISAVPLIQEEPNTPPVVAITSLYPLNGKVPLTVTCAGTGDDDKGVVRWEWIFGDGTSIEGEGNTASVEHTYESPGTYLVFLKMWDGDGAVGYAFAKVTAHPAHPGIEGTILVEGTAAQYLPLTVGAPALEARTDISELHWDFGDGSSAQGPEAVHTYTERGTYTVVLTTTFADGTTASDSVEVVVAENTPPSASFDVGGDEETRSFDASSSYDPEGAPLTYAWDFGDGTTAAGVSTTHAYGSSGTYVVTLTVSDGYHEGSAVRYLTISVPNMPPVARLSVCDTCIAGSTVTFDASASYDPEGAPLTYAWDFGDGNMGEGTQPSHTYESPGTYTAVLIVSDGTHTSTAFTTVAVGTDHRNILLYLIPLAAVVGGLALYMRRYGPKNTFEGVDLVKKGE